jgi:hypothetical protein
MVASWGSELSKTLLNVQREANIHGTNGCRVPCYTRLESALPTHRQRMLLEASHTRREVVEALHLSLRAPMSSGINCDVPHAKVRMHIAICGFITACHLPICQHGTIDQSLCLTNETKYLAATTSMLNSAIFSDSSNDFHIRSRRVLPELNRPWSNQHRNAT